MAPHQQLILTQTTVLYPYLLYSKLQSKMTVLITSVLIQLVLIGNVM